MNQVEPQKKELTLEKATLDLRTSQVQMIVGIVLAVVTCFVVYAPTLNVGFLLDDFLHLDYVARAAHGDWGDFVHNFYGNWAGSDIMKCYRPLSSTSFFIDYVIWGANAFGFHLTNVFLLAFCSLFVGLTTLELTGSYGNRIGAVAAVWAGLLFAVYPLHPEATAWAIGRVDLLCGLFYFASVFYYIRFRLLHEKGYLWGSLACFLLSFASKEMAVTLPAVILLYEFFMGSKDTRLLNRAKYVGVFFVTLAVASVARTLLLSTVIGGYETLGADNLMSIIAVFLDKATLLKLLIPVNEEVAVNPLLIKSLWISYALVALLFVARLVSRASAVRPFLFLLAWTIVLILPTFQVWHIHPNLVGSRLFFLSSAPFCMLFALMALPAVDVLTRGTSRILTLVGAGLLSIVFVGWGVMLSANLEPWINAGKIMSQVHEQVIQLASNTADGNRVLLLDIPRDYSGAGMLTRPQYLSFMARGPVSDKDYSQKLITIEPVISGNHDFMWPKQFTNMLNHPNVKDVLIWSRQSGKFESWTAAKLNSPEDIKLDFAMNGIKGLEFEPSNVITASADTWHAMSTKRPCLEKHADFIRVYPSASGLTIWLPIRSIDPRRLGVVLADLVKEDSSGCGGCLGSKVSLVWQTPGSNELKSAPIIHGHRRGYMVWLGRYRAWTLAPGIDKIGLAFKPGDYHVDLKSLEVSGDSTCVPRLTADGRTSVSALWMLPVKSGEKLQLNYDASAIPGAKLVKMLVTKPGVTIDAGNELEIDAYMPLLAEPMKDWEIKGTKGIFDVPDEIVRSQGVHQFQLVALDEFGNAVGFPSELVTIKVEK